MQQSTVPGAAALLHGLLLHQPDRTTAAHLPSLLLLRVQHPAPPCAPDWNKLMCRSVPSSLLPSFTFTGACLRSHSSCKRSSTCLELKSWTLPPRPALLTYHCAITWASLSCSFSPGLGFPNAFPRFLALHLSLPFLLNMG